MLTTVLLSVLFLAGCYGEDTGTRISMYTVSGNVTRSDNGGGIPKVEVTIGERSFRTGVTGYYELKLLPPGTYTIRANKDCCYDAYEATILVEGNVKHHIRLSPKLPG